MGKLVNAPGTWPLAIVSTRQYVYPFPQLLAHDCVPAPDVIEIENELDAHCAGELESLTWAVKLYCPAVVGVPPSVPVEPSVTPGGKPPEVTLQLYGGVPPVAVSPPA